MSAGRTIEPQETYTLETLKAILVSWLSEKYENGEFCRGEVCERLQHGNEFLNYVAGIA